MKETKKTTTTGRADSAEFEITGIVEKVYNGRDADYASIKVLPAPNDYYDLYRVEVAKEIGIEVGDEVTCTGQLSTFFDRQKKTQTIHFNATSVKPAKGYIRTN